MKRKLNVTVTIGPDTSRLVTESLLRIWNTHKEEFLLDLQKDYTSKDINEISKE
ncbi:MAG: hypothetical protein RSA29_18590 [Clostridium sp.]|uniref:hypothetical protein n=1 Tax=Clostridium sp. TaxID=1506 RepID=UPI00304D191D